jgi:hypothetical protein
MHSAYPSVRPVRDRRASGTYLAIAGDWHGFPLRVIAPQRLARCISKCMGLILRFGPYPTPLHVANNGLSAFVDVDMFDGDLLLSFAAMSIQRFEQSRVCS